MKTHSSGKGDFGNTNNIMQEKQYIMSYRIFCMYIDKMILNKNLFVLTSKGRKNLCKILRYTAGFLPIDAGREMKYNKPITDKD